MTYSFTCSHTSSFCNIYVSADIIERGIREHPELSVGMTTEGIEMRSVGNTLTLHETALIEAFNLRAAIEYHLKNCKSQDDMTSYLSVNNKFQDVLLLIKYLQY